ncbi:MAG: flagellar biosynthetic protein FliO [Actinobacteria bacterium]|nr:flagellar biosynthetic protein FliO [Actinomycetota bacterium]
MAELVLRIGASLLVVLGLMWLLTRVTRRPLQARSGGMLTVLARQQLSRGSSVAVLQLADRALLLGVTDQQVTLLANTDLPAVRRPEPRRVAVRTDRVQLHARRVPEGPARPVRGALAGSALSPRTWAQAVEVLRERTVRKS